MKQHLALTFALILAIFLIFTGCSFRTGDKSTGTNTITDSTNTPTTGSEFSIGAIGTISTEDNSVAKFPELNPEDPESLNVYRQLVKNRLTEKRYLLTEEEGYFLLSEGYSIEDFSISKRDSKYYFPMLFCFEGSVFLWQTSETGMVNTHVLQGNPSKFFGSHIGNLAYDYLDEQVLKTEFYQALTFSEANSKISIWEFGKVIDTVSLPDGSIYAGYSFFEGYIFRNGNDILTYGGYYAQFSETHSLRVIAHNVSFVIESDYAHNSDAWSVPLFLMTDGSIKAYVSWAGDSDVVDDPARLVDIQYEGGYPHR